MKEALPPDAVEQIAKVVAEVSDAVKKLRSGRLNDKALLLLISHASGQPQKVVRAVLDGMEGLKAEFLKKQPTP